MADKGEVMAEKIVAKVIAWIILLAVLYLISIIHNYFEKRNKNSEEFVTPVGNYPTYEELQQEVPYQTTLLVSGYPNKILSSGMPFMQRLKYEDSLNRPECVVTEILVSGYPNKILVSGMDNKQRTKWEDQLLEATRYNRNNHPSEVSSVVDSSSINFELPEE